ncbi:MAG: glycosyltransferase family 4 protein [bacterium]|nr:glycosyltransferase family 4 protein [bacterium]
MHNSAQLIVLNQFLGPTTVDIVNAFADAGCSPVVYCGTKSPHLSCPNASVVVRLRCGYNRASRLTRMWTWLRFSSRTLLELSFARKPFEVFAITNPPFNLFTALALFYLRGIPYHLLIFDIYPDAAIGVGAVDSRNPITSLWRYLNKLSFRHATSIFTISERMRDALLPYCDDRERIRVIHNWADNRRLRPISKEQNPFLANLGLQDRGIILYSGNFGKTHDVSTIVEAANVLVGRKDLYFLLIGDGEQKPLLRELISKYELTNVSLLPFSDDQTFPYSLASGDLAIVTLDAASATVSTPSKTYSSMAAGSAIIALAPEDSELSDLVHKHDMGVRVDPRNAVALAEAIERLFADQDRLAEYRRNSREASAHYTPANAQLYVDALLANGPAATAAAKRAD